MAKIFCYFILIVAFILFYQRNPVFGIIIIVVFIGGFIFFRLRKGTHGFEFLSRKNSTHTNQYNELLMLLILQSLSNDESASSSHIHASKEEVNPREREIETIKAEILELLDED